MFNLTEPSKREQSRAYFISGFESDGPSYQSPLDLSDYSSKFCGSRGYISVPPSHGRSVDLGRCRVNGVLYESAPADIQPVPEHEQTLPSPITEAVKQDSGPRDHQLPSRYWHLVKNHVQRICKLQEDVLGTRIMARQHRVSLKHQREEVADIGAELKKKLNAAEIFSVNNGSLLALLEQYQQARDIYQALEDNYHQFEDDLDQKEYELQKAEEKLQDICKQIGNHEFSPDSPDGVSDVGDDSSNSGPSTRSELIKYSPLEDKYLACLEEVHLLKERLWRLRDKQTNLIERQTSREQSGLSLDSESQAFLSQFEDYEKQICEELTMAQTDVKLLKMKCERQGLLKPTDDSIQGSDSEEGLLEPSAMQSINLLTKLWYEGIPSFFEDTTPSQDTISITGYINKWLLHQLCQSSFEIHRLRSAPELEKLPVDDQSFRDLVLHWWTKDAAAVKPVLRGHSEGDRESIFPEVNIGEVGHSRIRWSLEDRGELPEVGFRVNRRFTRVSV
jgi:hypothetical protein